MKKIISMLLCVVLVFGLCACGQKDTNQSTNNTTIPTIQDKEQPTDTKPSVDEEPTQATEPEDTEPENTNPSVDDDSIKLKQFKDANELFIPFEGKIEKLFGNAKQLTFYSDGGIYHPVDDDISQEVMHKFNIGNVDKIYFYYHEPNVHIYGRISSEICVYTKPNDDKTYVSITAKSDDYTQSEALTMSIDCNPEDVLFAYRDVDEVFVISQNSDGVRCSHYDFSNNELLGSGIVYGLDNDDNKIELKLLCSDGRRGYAIDTSGKCSLVETSFGDMIEEEDGEYFVNLYPQYCFDNAKNMLTYEYDSIFIMDNDIDNIHHWSFVSGGEIVHVKAKMPKGLTINDIKQTWGTDDCLIVEFNDGQYYLLEEISSFETDEFVEMEKLEFNIQEHQIVGFSCEGFDLIVLLSDGNIYVCEDVL